MLQLIVSNYKHVILQSALQQSKVDFIETLRNSLDSTPYILKGGTLTVACLTNSKCRCSNIQLCNHNVETSRDKTFGHDFNHKQSLCLSVSIFKDVYTNNKSDCIMCQHVMLVKIMDTNICLCLGYSSGEGTLICGITFV